MAVEQSLQNQQDLFIRKFTFLSKECIHILSISENSEYLPGHGSIIWAGSVLFSFHLLHSPAFRSGFENKRILDLGSGCGMTAMAAAISFPTSTVIASDLHANVKHLERMIELNGLQDKCKAMALDWNNPNGSTKENEGKETKGCIHPAESFDTVIGCEVVYHEPILLPLLNTVDYHLKKNGGLLYLISARHRHCYLQLFYELQERGYEIVRIEALTVPYIPADGFVDPVKIQIELDKMKGNVSIYKGEALGEIQLTPSEELSVGWFSEGEFLYDLDKLVMVIARRR
jgi:2-polyprenyl-3-methyl-5-hydroxy-6-metoxy-1,4-benzoquinol methylase